MNVNELLNKDVLTLREQLFVVSYEPSYIMLINNPAAEAIDAAITKQPFLILRLKNVSETLLRWAIDHHNYLIPELNLSGNLQLYAINSDYKNIQLLKQTSHIQIYALRTNSNSYYFMKPLPETTEWINKHYKTKQGVPDFTLKQS